MRASLLATALLVLALPLSRAHVAGPVPQRLSREQATPGCSLGLAAPAPGPAPEALLGRKGGPSGGPAPEGAGLPSAPAPDAAVSGLTGLGAGTSLGGGVGVDGSAGAGKGSAGATGVDSSSGAGVTMPAAGGSEFDLTGTLFNGNAQAFTQAVLASGTSSAAIAISGMLQLPDPTTIKTLKECLSGPEPGASAVAKAVTAAFQMSVCQSPQLNQDATATAVSGAGPLATAAARGLSRAAMQCCSKVAEHLAGALVSLEAGPSFVSDLDAALKATGSSLPACALPSQLVLATPAMSKHSSWVALLACLQLLGSAGGLQDGLARTPPLGFNTWNAFGGNLSEEVVCSMAKLMRELELVEAGYRYLVMDDGWSDPERDASGRLQADRSRFPSGIKAVADCVREQGLLLGVYGDSGRYTCQGFPGSYGHEQEDAQTFAEWGVSLLKFDNCFSEGEGEVMERFVAMRDALLATNASIVYMLCEWGIGDPWAWGPQVAHSWRTTFDIHASWESVMQNLDESVGLARFSGPGEWNDLDMLEIGGTWPQPNDRRYLQVCLDALAEQPPNRFLSEKEERAHFALWAILKSPLMIAADLRSIRPSSLAVLKAKEIIAINQDALGVAGDLIWKQGPKEVFAAPLAGGGRAVVLHNRHSLLSQYQTSSFSVRWEQLGYAPGTPATVRDLWRGEDLGVFNASFSAQVRLHDALAFRITPLYPLPSHSEWRPWLGQPIYERHEEDEGWIPPLGAPAAAD